MSNYEGTTMTTDQTQKERRQALFNRGMALIVLGAIVALLSWVMVTSDDMGTAGIVGLIIGLGLLAGGFVALSKR